MGMKMSDEAAKVHELWKQAHHSLEKGSNPTPLGWFMMGWEAHKAAEPEVTHTHKWVVEVEDATPFDYDLNPGRTTRRQGKAVDLGGVYDYESNHRYPWANVADVFCAICGAKLALLPGGVS